MNVEVSLQTYEIIVRPILEYCSAISLDTMKKKVTEAIEKVKKDLHVIAFSHMRICRIVSHSQLVDCDEIHPHRKGEVGGNTYFIILHLQKLQKNKNF